MTRIRLIAAAAVVALFAVACNGHEDATHDQLILKSGTFILDHNHGITGSAVPYAEMDFGYLPSGYTAQVCLNWVWVDDASGDVVNGDPNDCSGIVTGEINGGSTFVIGQPSPGAGTTAEAFESTVYITGPGNTFWECQYHDPDESNTSICPGRDLDGN